MDICYGWRNGGADELGAFDADRIAPLGLSELGARRVIWTVIATVLGGGLTLSGIAYPSLAAAKPGWKVGSWAGGAFWTLWYLAGVLAYFGGMFDLWRWWGLVAAPPLAFAVGLGITALIGRQMQIVSLSGPILANLWFWTR